MVHMEASKVRLNQHLLDKYCQVTGLEFPQDYLEFLYKYNGGTPSSNIVELYHGEIESFSITEFFGFGLESNYDIPFQTDLLNDRIPKGCVPIAEVEGGNIICISLEAGYCGQIFLWDHEKEETNVNDLQLVAKSFSEFIANILDYKSEDANLSGYSVKKIWIDPDFLKEIRSKNRKTRSLFHV